MEPQVDFDLLRDADRLAQYLIAQGQTRPGYPIQVEPLGGGVSNRIVRVTSDSDSFVVKQAQPKLQVKVDWFAPVDRILIEARSMQALYGLLPAGTVPRVRFIDEARYLYGMEGISGAAETWKALLLRNEADESIASRAGGILARLHARSAADARIRAAFQDTRILEALRVDPCFLYLKDIHPDLSSRIDEQVDRLFDVRLCLVHGDYTPKNMLIEGDRLVLLDYEISHWGNPALDSGFVLAHLLLKAVHLPQWAPSYVQFGRAFWRAYVGDCGLATDHELEAETACLVPFLVLARIDSKSPVEYITAEPQKDLARRFARRFIQNPSPHLEDLFQVLENQEPFAERGIGPAQETG